MSKTKETPKVLPEQVIDKLREAESSLSHCSYCEITGTRPNRKALDKGWEALHEVIEALAPREDFREDDDPEKERPYLKVVGCE